MNMETITVYAYIVLLLWGLSTTVYGLYLSRRNNQTYNVKIIEELKEIKEAIKRGNNKL